MSTVKYIRPSGREIEVNDDEHTRAYAIANKWQRVKNKPGPKPKDSDDNPNKLDSEDQ